MKLTVVSLLVLVASLNLQAQQKPEAGAPAPAPLASAPTAPKLDRVDELERENIRLAAMVTDLQRQLAERTAELQGRQVQQRAAAFVEKMKATHPDWQIDPSTLELIPKQAATSTPTPEVKAPQP